jgi:hypothetical protein
MKNKLKHIIPNKKNLLFMLVSFLAGGIFVRALDIHLITTNYQNSRDLIDNANQTFEVQKKITENYKSAFDKIYYCLLCPPESCQVEETIAGFKNIQTERDNLITELNQLGEQTKAIVTRIESQ